MNGFDYGKANPEEVDAQLGAYPADSGNDLVDAVVYSVGELIKPEAAYGPYASRIDNWTWAVGLNDGPGFDVALEVTLLDWGLGPRVSFDSHSIMAWFVLGPLALILRYYGREMFEGE